MISTHPLPPTLSATSPSTGRRQIQPTEYWHPSVLRTTTVEIRRMRLGSTCSPAPPAITASEPVVGVTTHKPARTRGRGHSRVPVPEYSGSTTRRFPPLTSGQQKLLRSCSKQEDGWGLLHRRPLFFGNPAGGGKPALSRMQKNSSFVSGYRISDTASSSNQTPLQGQGLEHWLFQQPLTFLRNASLPVRFRALQSKFTLFRGRLHEKLLAAVCPPLCCGDRFVQHRAG